MKIIWNNPSPSNTPSDTVEQTEQTTQNDTSRIALPKPSGQWLQNPEVVAVENEVLTEPSVSKPKIHVPEATRQHLQRLSIQEINLYEQHEQIQEVECTKDVGESEATEVIAIDSPTQPNTFVDQTETIDTVAKDKQTVNIKTQNDQEQIQNENTSTELTAPIEQTETSETKESHPVDSIQQHVFSDTKTASENTIVLPSALFEIEDTAALELTQTTAANKDRFAAHQAELRQMAVFCLSIFTMALVPYTSPALADYRPWTSNEAPPLIGLWTQQQKMTEDSSGALVVVDEDNEAGFNSEISVDASSTLEVFADNDITKADNLLERDVQEEEVLSAINDIAIVVPTKDHLEPLEPRSPAKPEKLHMPKGALDQYFTKLSLIEDGTDQVARALVWGDSTIASDGIIKDVRGRMQDRFGDSGPGFLAAKVDRRWAFRRDIVRKTEGSWSAKNIVHGGATDSRYGLAGTVSIAHPGARSTLGGIEIDDERQDLHRFQVFYQRAPNGGDLTLSTQSKTRSLSTQSDNISDAYYELIVPSGDPYVYLEAQNSNVVIYGVALEVDRPGVTWETFGVAGSSISSMQKQHDAHLSNQIAARDPSLLVYWTGGNELGYPSLKSSTGKGYKKYYRKVVRNLKDGAPQASCLLIGPLDQATRQNGQIVSKPTLDKLIRFQREVAEEEGCAYWDARAAMGGNNAFKEWLSYKPSLASPDLAHLTGRGRKRIGDTLADVLMREYDLWRIDNPEIFWNPEESVADPTGDLWHWECDNPEPSTYELMLNELSKEDVCTL